MSIEELAIAAPAGQETATQADTGTDSRYNGFSSPDELEQGTASQTVEAGAAADGEDQPDALDGADTDQQDSTTPDPWEGYEDFEIDGKVYKVPSEIKDGYLRTADYTRKTQEVSETRKQLQSREQELNQRFDHSEQEFNAWIELTEVSKQLDRVKDVDWNAEAQKLADDPIAFQELQRVYMQFQQLQQRGQQLTDQTKQFAQARTDAAKQETATRLTATRDYAEKNIKGWTPELDAKITDFAMTTGGFDRETLTSALTPQVYSLLHLAFLGHQSQTRQQTAKPTPQTVSLTPTQTVTAKASVQGSFDPEKSSMSDYARDFAARQRKR